MVRTPYLATFIVPCSLLALENNQYARIYILLCVTGLKTKCTKAEVMFGHLMASTSNYNTSYNTL